jgi:hypothetical protein
MFNEFFFAILATNKIGYKLIHKIWSQLYDSNDEKINRTDTKLVMEIMKILLIDHEYSNYIILVQIPITLQYRCSIAIIGGNSTGEYIYVSPDGDDMSQMGPEYLTYPIMYQTATDFIINYKNILNQQTKI